MNTETSRLFENPAPTTSTTQERALWANNYANQHPGISIKTLQIATKQRFGVSLGIETLQSITRGDGIPATRPRDQPHPENCTCGSHRRYSNVRKLQPKKAPVAIAPAPVEQSSAPAKAAWFGSELEEQLAMAKKYGIQEVQLANGTKFILGEK